MAGLSEEDRDILEFERDWWRHATAKEQACRERFGLSPGDYYQRLSRLIDTAEALDHDPLLVRRLRRLRSARRHDRATRRAGQRTS